MSMTGRFTVASLLVLALGACGDDSDSSPRPSGTPAAVTEFNYAGDSGPGFWGELDEAWFNCSADTRQSPVDIVNPVTDAALAPLALDLHETPLNLINNGHTIEQEYEPGSTLTLNGAVYELRQFHFHSLSEHAIGGHPLAMEMHAVFRDAASGNLAVIGTLFEIGDENEFLAAFSSRLPALSGDRSRDAAVELDLAEGLTDTAQYYRYDGSLTTPPCSPIVTWFVLKQPAELSAAQYESFRSILGNNFRPLQPLNGREIRATP